jgi:hypothetical protein
VALAAVVGGCSSGDGDSTTSATSGTARADSAARAARAESLYSTANLLKKFREQTPDRPTELGEASESRDELVRRFARAVEKRDTSEMRAMLVSRGEFAYIFFPASPYAHPPYELDPAVVWMQLVAESDKGARRLFRTYGAREMGYVGHICPDLPQERDGVRIWGCNVQRVLAPGDTVTERLFGAIIEHDGRFKFASYANKL